MSADLHQHHRFACHVRQLVLASEFGDSDSNEQVHDLQVIVLVWAIHRGFRTTCVWSKAYVDFEFVSIQCWQKKNY